MWHFLAVGIGATGLLAFLGAYFSCRQDMQAARKRVARQSQLIQTPCGWIEYGTAGHGAPVLVIHGAGGGFDQGLHLGSMLVVEGFRLVAPSRFGYLKTPVPEDHSLEAQADMLAFLLDALEIDRIAVVAISAGGLTGLQFAHRHPERTAALVMVAAVSHTDLTATDDRKREALINRMVGSDFVYWLAIHAARPPLLLILGVSDRIQKGLTPKESAAVDEILAFMLPVSQRFKGTVLDQSRYMPSNFPLDQINVPTLVIHAKDDSLVDWSQGCHAAANIRGAELMTLEQGGHFLLGHEDEIRTRIVPFLEDALGRAPGNH